MPTIGNKPIVQIYYNSKRVLFDPFITLTVDKSKVDDNLTDFPVYVKLTDIKPDITLTEAQSIRIYKADGTTELPRDIVTKDKMRFKADLSSSNDTVFKIKMDGVSSDYGVSDTYGRNNVYTKYKAFYDFASGNSNDRTGNGYNGSDSGVSYSGDYASFNGTNSKINLGVGQLEYPSSGTTSVYNKGISIVLETNDNTNRGVLQLGDSIDNWSVPVLFISNSSKVMSSIGWHGQTTTVESNSTITTSTKYYITIQYNGGTETIYINGVNVGSRSSIDVIGKSGLYYWLGYSVIWKEYGSGKQYFDGKVYKINSHSTFPSTRVSTEYNNQSSPSTFYTIS